MSFVLPLAQNDFYVPSLAAVFPFAYGHLLSGVSQNPSTVKFPKKTVSRSP